MAGTPLIVSLWRGPIERKDDLLCSGLLLGGRYILTVRHAFTDWSDQTPVQVRQIQGHSVVPAKVLQRHREYDAAILELVTPVAHTPSPDLLRDPTALEDLKRAGRAVTLRFIDPDHFGWSEPPNYAVARRSVACPRACPA